MGTGLNSFRVKKLPKVGCSACRRRWIFEGAFFRLCFTSRTWAGRLGRFTHADLEVPAPRLPVAAPSLERTWRLAPGLVPLDGASAYQLQGQTLPAGEAGLRPSADGWTAWQPRPGLTQEVRLRVFLAGSLRTLGIGIGLLSLALAWLVRRASWVGYCRFGILWLLGLGLVLMQLPSGLQPMLGWAEFVFALGFGLVLLRSRWATSAPSERQGSDLAKAVIAGSSIWLLFMPGNLLTHTRSEGPESFQAIAGWRRAKQAVRFGEPGFG